MVKNRVLLAVGFGALVCLFTVWQAEALKSSKGTKTRYQSLKGLVTDSHDRPLVGATVYFIDTASIDTTPITVANMQTGVAEAYDEPLEDIVNNADKAALLPKAVTDKKGKYSVKKLDASKTYYAFVVPHVADPADPADVSDIDHVPGGSATRVAFSPKSQKKGGLHIKMSWFAPTDATYIGSTACYACHGAGSESDVTSNKKHGHSLMFKKPASDTGLQDSASHVGASWNEFANKFTLATAYNKPVAPATSVETLYVQDYDSTASNKFVLYENTKGTSTVYCKLYLWKTAAGVYNVTIENVITPTDPNNFVTLEVPLLIGGYMRQRLLVKVAGLKSLYKFIGYQAITGAASQGYLSNNYDRARKPFTEGGSGGGSFTDFFDATTKKIKFPTKSTSNITCASCHIGGGAMVTSVDATTGENVATTVTDATNGLYDLAGNGTLQEMSIGCEQCHGPGSKHRDTAQAMSARKKEVVEDTAGKYIVNPEYLGADRAALICGSCHQSAGGLYSSSGKSFFRPGISRAEYLKTYVKTTNKTIASTKLWPDLKHERGGHEGVAYYNFLQSKHFRNEKQMVSCDDCHDSMGDSPYRYSLKGDPESSTGGLCQNCHDVDIAVHVPEKTGSEMSGQGMNCINCHMTRTGRGGAGRPGLLLGTPTGITTDANITYWEGDQSSHIWDVPNKFTPGVAGTTPGSAMPTPYTNSCGTCHDASKLQYQVPSN
jgi:hypothetical protein